MGRALGIFEKGSDGGRNLLGHRWAALPRNFLSPAWSIHILSETTLCLYKWGECGLYLNKTKINESKLIVATKEDWCASWKVIRDTTGNVRSRGNPGPVSLKADRHWSFCVDLCWVLADRVLGFVLLFLLPFRTSLNLSVYSPRRAVTETDRAGGK